MSLDILKTVAGSLMGFLGLLLLGLEIRYRWRVQERIEITAKGCQVIVIHPQQGRLQGTLDLHNPVAGVETVLLEVHTQVTLLAAISLPPSQPSAPPAKLGEICQDPAIAILDRAWEAKTLEPGESLQLSLDWPIVHDNLDTFQAVRLTIESMLYSREGLISQRQQMIIPIEVDGADAQITRLQQLPKDT